MANYQKTEHVSNNSNGCKRLWQVTQAVRKKKKHRLEKRITKLPVCTEAYTSQIRYIPQSWGTQQLPGMPVGLYTTTLRLSPWPWHGLLCGQSRHSVTIRERITDTRYGCEKKKTKKNEFARMVIKLMAIGLVPQRSNHWATETPHLKHHIQVCYHLYLLSVLW